MIGRILKRIGWSSLVLYCVITATFFLMNAVGDPATAQLGAQASAAQRAEYRRLRGLDKPVFERYGTFVAGLARGDFGVSYRPEAPRVSEIIAPRLPRTMLLGVMALSFELLLGVTIGTIAASRRGRWLDYALMSAAFVGVSAPTFLTGILFMYGLAFALGWFPLGGYGVDAIDHVRHAFLPAFTLAIAGSASLARIVRSDVSEALSSDYVRTARAKGLSHMRALFVHALRNSLVSVVTMMGMSLPLLVAGAIITEQIYGWPGVGRLAVESISNGDTPVVMAIVVLSSGAVQLGTLLADVTVMWLDPRTRA